MSVDNNFPEGTEEAEFFKGLVSMAMADGKITHEEYDLLYVIGRKAGVPHDDVDQVIRNAVGFHYIRKSDDDTNKKRLINLIKMMCADGEIDANEIALIEKFAEGLGYSGEHSTEMIKRISSMVIDNMNEEEIITALK